MYLLHVYITCLIMYIDVESTLLLRMRVLVALDWTKQMYKIKYCYEIMRLL